MPTFGRIRQRSSEEMEQACSVDPDPAPRLRAPLGRGVRSRRGRPADPTMSPAGSRPSRSSRQRQRRMLARARTRWDRRSCTYVEASVLLGSVESAQEDAPDLADLWSSRSPQRHCGPSAGTPTRTPRPPSRSGVAGRSRSPRCRRTGSSHRIWQASSTTVPSRSGSSRSSFSKASRLLRIVSHLKQDGEVRPDLPGGHAVPLLLVESESIGRG